MKTDTNKSLETENPYSVNDYGCLRYAFADGSNLQKEKDKAIIDKLVNALFYVVQGYENTATQLADELNTDYDPEYYVSIREAKELLKSIEQDI